MTIYHHRPLLYAEVVEQIKQKIELGEWRADDRIPAESELTALFKVSRATLREGIAYLVNKGILVRKRGIGTFVGRKEEIAGGLETLVSITQWIAGHGYTPGTKDILFLKRLPSPVEQELFQSLIGDAVGEIRRVRTANGNPVIYCVDVLPSHLMPSDLTELGESLMDYLEVHGGQVVALAHSTIDVIMATREMAEKLHVTPGTPLLRLKQIHFNQAMAPLLLSQDHFLPERFKFDMVRRRL